MLDAALPGPHAHLLAGLSRREGPRHAARSRRLPAATCGRCPDSGDSTAPALDEPDAGTPGPDPAAVTAAAPAASSPTSSSSSATSPRSASEQAIDEARTAGRTAGAAAARAGRDHRGPALAGDRRALRPRPRRPLRLPGRHGGGEPDPGQHGAPLPGACRSASSTSRRCWSRWPTRPTCSPSTTSRSRPGSTAASRSPPREDIEALIGRLNTLQSAVTEAVIEERGGRGGGRARRGQRHARSAPRTRR